MTPLELERCVILANDATSPQHWEATNVLNNWVETNVTNTNTNNNNNNTTSSTTTNKEGCDAVSHSLLALLQTSKVESVLFYALTTLQRLITTTTTTAATTDNNNNEGATGIRLELRNYLLTNPSTLFHPKDSSTYLKTKACVVLALLIRIDFPNQTWVQPFDDIYRKLSSEIFLRTMDTFLEELDLTLGGGGENGSNNDNNNNSSSGGGFTGSSSRGNISSDNISLIRDVMRGIAINNNNNNNSAQALLPTEQTISARLIGWLLTLFESSFTTLLNISNSGTANGLSSASAATTRTAGQQEELICSLSLTVVKRLASWVDLILFLQEERVLSMIYTALDSNINDIVIPAVHTLQELVIRGLTPETRKVSMLSNDLALLQRIHDCNNINLDILDETHIDIVIEVAKLINVVGLELLPIWDDMMVMQSNCNNDSNNFVGDDNESGSTNDETTLQQLSILLQQLLDFFFRCFSYDDIDVSGAVIPLATRLTISLGKEIERDNKKEQTATDNISNGHGHNSGISSSSNIKTKTAASSSNLFRVSNHLAQILTIMFQQMRYPNDFQFDYNDNEDEAEEEVYRIELRKLNLSFVRIVPDICLQFICEALANLPVPISTSSTPDIEACLRLVYHYCEGIQPPPGLKVVMKNDTFCAILVALHGSSDITLHPHQEVLLLYYDIAVRYYPIYKDRPESLPPLLEAMSGPRGLQHSHPRVRSRSCYLLLRLVKSVVGFGVMRPYVETAVGGIEGLLSNPTAHSLRPEDTLYLFETIGLLLGKTGLDSVEQQRCLTNLMTTHVRSIEEVVQSLKLKQRDPDECGIVLSHALASIAYISKGFTKPPEEVQLVLLETFQVTLSVLEALPRNDEIRSKSMILIQRMIQCLKQRVLPMMPGLLYLLIENCTAEDILDVGQLLNQLCVKFKGNCISTIDAALLPFLRKSHSLMPSIDEVVVPHHISTGTGCNAARTGVDAIGSESSNCATILPPHLVTEQLSIKKLSFVFLQYVVTNRATAVLLTPTNVNALEDVLKIMYDGAVNAATDPTMKKSCVTFFRELTDQWAPQEALRGGGNTNNEENFAAVQIGFVRFVFEVFLPGVINFMLDRSFNEKDAMQSRIIIEIANIMIVLKTKRPLDEFERYVIGDILNVKVRCPPDLVEGFRNASNSKEMDLCLKGMLKIMKQQ